jgi:hypothetical protein
MAVARSRLRGRRGVPFMIHIYAALAEGERALISQRTSPRLLVGASIGYLAPIPVFDFAAIVIENFYREPYSPFRLVRV